MLLRALELCTQKGVMLVYNTAALHRVEQVQPSGQFRPLGLRIACLVQPVRFRSRLSRMLGAPGTVNPLLAEQTLAVAPPTHH